MSTRIMTKQCRHCHRTYTYNPSTGDLGTICKHCHRSQTQGLSVPVLKKEPYKNKTLPRFPKAPKF